MVNNNEATLTRICGRFRSLLAAAFCAAVLSAGATAAVTHDVRVEDHEFNPPVITIAPGDTVKWTAYGNDHTVTSDDPSGFDSSTAMEDPAIPLFQSFSVTFPAAGTFPYYCQVHGGPGGIGMAGRIIVRVPGGNTPPAKPVNTAPANGATAVSVTPVLQASAFSDADMDDVHASSRWVIKRVSDGVAVVEVEDTAQKTSFTPAALANDTQFSWTVQYKDGAGDWSQPSDPTTFTTVPAVSSAGSGLLASYGTYNKKNGAVKINAQQVDPLVDFDWKLGKPHKSAPANFMYVRWEGDVLPPTSAEYRFRIVADGGVRLWVNGELIIDDWKAGKFAIFRSGVALLDAGVPASIKLEYFDTTGKASVKLRWITATRPLEVIPTSVLYPASND